MHRFARLTGLMIITALATSCATVTTEVVPLRPGLTLPPTRDVEILLEKPQRPYRELALLESRGWIGDSEAQLWQDAREKARALGADALIRLELHRTVYPPVAYYDPFVTPYYSPFYPSPYFFPSPFPEYRVFPGGAAYTLKTMAISYADNAREKK
jgi:hypothetical protein